MSSALIGHTGFVGGTLLREASFEGLYNSSNIGDLAGRTFDVIFCAGAPAVKWMANKDPEADWVSLSRLMAALGRANASHVVLISTVDVYDPPQGVDEETEIDRTAGHAYGRHRLLLEDFVRDRFSATVVRLPGLFGEGLKKNIIYDFLHGNQLDAVCPDSVFQFYGLHRLWRDLSRIRALGLPLVNLATEPVSVRDVARHAFGFDFENPDAKSPARYDMKTSYAALLGGVDGYLCGAETVLDELAEFVARSGGRQI